MVIHRKTDPAEIAPYLKDASNFSGGQADEVWVPETRKELVSILKDNDRLITIAGAGTGLTASRIPLSGIIISMERHSYLRDAWNILDFMVVILGWLAIIFENSGDISAIKVIRILRPLRTIN